MGGTMAFAWIKIEDSTPDKPEVWKMAERLGIDADAVLGKLVRVWIWADQQTIDGNAHSVTKALLDRTAGVTGFADAMIRVGWLRAVEDGVEFRNFDRHNGETAKKRALTRRRVEKHRAGNADSVTESENGNADSVTKRREEKNLNTKRKTRTREQTDADRLAAEAAASEDDPVLIPAKMNTEPVMRAFRQWVRHLRQVAPDRVPPPGSPQLQEFWRFVARMGPDRFIAAVAFSVARGYHNLYEEREDHGSGQSGGRSGTSYQSPAERREANNARAFETVFGASPPGWTGSAAALQCEADRVHAGAVAHLGDGVELLPAE